MAVNNTHTHYIGYMKKFNEWLKALNESITFKIADTSDDQQDIDLPEAIFNLNLRVKKMFSGTFDATNTTAATLPQVDQVITYDGDYFSNGREEINFYAGFVPELSRKKILDAILYLLNEFNMKQNGPIRSDISRLYKNIMVYRIPVIVQNNKDPAPELNVGSGNAKELFKLLGIKMEGWGSINVADLNIRLNQLTDFEKQMALRADDIGKGFVSFGLTERQLEMYLERLEKMVVWAMKHGYDTISYS
jgi:hypothetical protein